jgi:hypothetical protein
MMIKILLYCVLLLYFSSCKNESTDKEIHSFDDAFYPLILSASYVKSPQLKTGEITTDEMKEDREILLQWIVLSSPYGSIASYCLVALRKANKYDLELVSFGSNSSCLESDNVVSRIHLLTRVFISWKNDKREMVLEFEYFFQEKIMKKDFSYPMLFWQGAESLKNSSYLEVTERKLYQDSKNLWMFSGIMPLFENKNSYVQSMLHYKEQLVKCHEVNDACLEVTPNSCDLCTDGVYELFDTKCSVSGTKYCGQPKCGYKGEPACYLGRRHILQEDFLGCHDLSEEFICSAGLTLACKENTYPVCQ